MKSLYIKFVITTLGIMVLSFLIAFFISNVYYQQNLKPQNDAKNTQIATEIAEFIESTPSLDIDAYLNNISEIGYQLYIVSESGSESYYGADFRKTSLSEGIINSTLNGQIYHGMRDFPKETFVTGFFANELENTIGVPVHYENENYAVFIRPDIKLLFDEMHLLFGILFVMTVILSIIFVLAGAGFLIRPVTNLSKATKKVTEGEYHFKHLPVKRKDELGQLSRSFIEMVERIEENENMRKDFISNISHDIGAPLSNIKGYISLLSRKVITADEKEKYISVINEEATRISIMTKQLLVLSSLEHESHIMKNESFDVSVQIASLLQSYGWKLDEKEIMLGYALEPSEIEADKTLLNMVWDNLLSNALKYTNAGGEIDIQLKNNDKYIVITVGDTGIGIDEKSKRRVFERFYRVDDVRGNNVEGTGLGLSIVKQIIEMHHGEIKVESSDSGTLFTVTIPRK